MQPLDDPPVVRQEPTQFPGSLFPGYPSSRIPSSLVARYPSQP